MVDDVVVEDLVRPAGLLERYHITRQYLGLDTCVIIAAKYTGADGLHLDRATIFRALKRAVPEHAALSLRLSGDPSKKPLFARIKSFDLDSIVRFVDENDKGLQSFLENEFKQPFDTSSGLPLWRLTVMADNTVVFAWHHCIGDGLSGLAFHTSLLKALNDSDKVLPVGEDLNSGLLQIVDKSDFLPPIEKLTDLSVSWSTLLHAIGKIIIPAAWLGASTWTGNNVISSPTSTRLRVRIVPLAPATVARLTSLVKSHHATLTSTIYILAVSTLSQLILSDPNQSTIKRISVSVPVSLRTFANTPMTAMCNQVSAVHSNPNLLSSGFSWTAASEFAQTLRNSLKDARQLIGSLKYLFGHYEGYFMGKLGSKRDGGLEISNLGAFKLNDLTTTAATSTWRIGETYFAQNDFVLGAAMKMNVVGNPEGGASICITWGEGAVDDGFKDAFIENFRTALDDLLTAG